VIAKRALLLCLPKRDHREEERSKFHGDPSQACLSEIRIWKMAGTKWLQSLPLEVNPTGIYASNPFPLVPPK